VEVNPVVEGKIKLIKIIGLFTAFNFECAITGLKRKDHPLIVHHLISAHLNEDLAYDPNNGITLTPSLHMFFHKKFGYRNNSIGQMKSFLIYLLDKRNQKEIYLTLREFETKNPFLTPISSQATSEEVEGSETRAYDPERVMKLHERLEQIEKDIYTMYFSCD
jgi:hypothetical protein